MVMNSFGNRNFMQPMERLSTHSLWALFFPFGGGLQGGFFLFFLLVPTLFVTCSHYVPLKFLKFSSCSLRRSQEHLNFIPYGLPFNSHVRNLKRWAVGKCNLFLFCNWGSKEVLSIGWVLNLPKTFADGPMNMALLKKNKNKRIMTTAMN